MKKAAWILVCVVSGAVGFWAPDVLLQAKRGPQFSGRDVLLLSLLMPLAVLVSYCILFRLSKALRHAQSIAFFMLVGIWLLGSSAMMISATFSGGGFAGPASDVWPVIALGILPPYTLVMATYDGSLLALGMVTLVMLLVGFVFERDRWIVPADLPFVSALACVSNSVRDVGASLKALRL